MYEHICIGGPLAGQHIEVPCPKGFTATLIAEQGKVTKIVSHSYSAAEFRFSEGTTVVWALEGLSPQDILNELLTTYEDYHGEEDCDV